MELPFPQQLHIKQECPCLKLQSIYNHFPYINSMDPRKMYRHWFCCLLLKLDKYLNIHLTWNNFFFVLLRLYKNQIKNLTDFCYNELIPGNEVLVVP